MARAVRDVPQVVSTVAVVVVSRCVVLQGGLVVARAVRHVPQVVGTAGAGHQGEVKGSVVLIRSLIVQEGHVGAHLVAPVPVVPMAHQHNQLG